MIEHKLKLRFDDSFNGILFSTQGDTGRVFEVEVRDELDNAIDIAGHKLEFYVGNEKKVTKVEASIQGNKFVVRPVNEQFTKAGLNKAQFVLYDKEGLQVGSQIFDLHVEESIQQGATVGSNVVVDFGILQEALKLIKGYEKTFEDSKGLDATLNASIAEGRKVDQALKSDTSAARGVDANIKTSTTKASETYTKLEATRGSANTLNNDLKSNISQGNKTNSNLQSSIGTANNTQNSLQDKTAQGIEINTKLGQSIKTGQGIVSNIATSDRGLASTISSANNSKINLDNSISKAETSKTNLDGFISAANTAKTKLDESTSKGNTTNNNLKSTDSKAGASISTLQDLLNRSASTEQSLKEIIASGNLDKYVTTPKLEEALAKIKTLKKEVVDTLPQAGKDDVIYLVKDSKGKANNVYLEYLWINGAFELIGSTEVDLSGYMKEAAFYETWNDFLEEANKNIIDTNVKLSNKVDKTQITNEYALDDTTKVPSSKALLEAINLMDNNKVDKVDGKGLSSNDYTNDDKTRVEGLPMIEGALHDFSTQIKSNTKNLESSAESYNTLSHIVADQEGKLEDHTGQIGLLAQQLGNCISDIADLKNDKADKTKIKTKLSEMQEDSTHRTVTDEEKEKWNKSGSGTGYEEAKTSAMLDGGYIGIRLVKVGKIVHVYATTQTIPGDLQYLNSISGSWQPDQTCSLGNFKLYKSNERQIIVANVLVSERGVFAKKLAGYPKSYPNNDFNTFYQYLGSYTTK